MDFNPTNEFFTPCRTDQSLLPFVERPKLTRKFSRFESSDGAFEAYISKEVLVSVRSEARNVNETMGLLAGRVLCDELGPYTLVLAAEGAYANELEATPSRVHISGQGSRTVRRRLENRAYGLDVVGWYHTHPNFQPLFSHEDKIEQTTWSNPNHLGLVVSGRRVTEPFGVYRGPHSAELSPVKDGFLDDSNETLDEVPIAALPKKAIPVTITKPDASGALTESSRLDLYRLQPLAIVVGLIMTATGLWWVNHRLVAIERALATGDNTQTERGADAKASDATTGTSGKTASPDSRVAETPAESNAVESEEIKSNPKLPAIATPSNVRGRRQSQRRKPAR